MKETPPFDLHKIAQLLKDSREEKGLAVADVSRALCISKRIIGAIESGDWDALPPPVYVKAFVTQYAVLLHIVDAVEAGLTPTATQPPSETQHVVIVHKKEGAQKGQGSVKKIMVAAAIVAVAVAFLIFQNAPQSTPVIPSTEPTPAPPSAPTTPAAPPVEATPVSPSTPASAVVEEKGKPVPEEKKLTILCHERTWVRVVIDGAERKEFMLNPEDIVILDAKERFELVIGNAGGVTLLYNGKDTGFTGKSGEVRSVRLP